MTRHTRFARKVFVDVPGAMPIEQYICGGIWVEDGVVYELFAGYVDASDWTQFCCPAYRETHYAVFADVLLTVACAHCDLAIEAAAEYLNDNGQPFLVYNA